MFKDYSIVSYIMCGAYRVADLKVISPRLYHRVNNTFWLYNVFASKLVNHSVSVGVGEGGQE